MRIITGRHRGRKLVVPKGLEVRPTSDRAREALFNILEHGDYGLAGGRVVDLFCGTGALGLEALSRGAVHATLVDSDAKALDAARANAERLGETSRVTLLRLDATRLRAAPVPCDLAFLDPPYRSGLAPAALVALARGGWLGAGATAIAEIGRKERLDAPPGFAVADERTYGSARLVFLVWEGASAA
jgi:16S rRNA (guanine966-N2)-methyltransferase